MRIALCQINPTVADFDGNRALCLRAARQAQADGAALAVLPELALLGYPPRDLLDRPEIITHGLEALERLRTELPKELSVLVGFVDRREDRLYNAAALIRDGVIAQVFHKRLLPTYDVFDEDRYFEPGSLPATFELRGTRFGVTICEDAWNDDGALGRFYTGNPVRECMREGAAVLLNLAASPFTLHKRMARPRMLSEVAKRHARPFLFVNTVGGNDDLIFDGSSAVFDVDGAMISRCNSFEEGTLLCELGPAGAPIGVPLPPQTPSRPPEGSDAAVALDALTLGTRDFVRKCGFASVVLGLSGGIDSALVAAIAARALGPANVLAMAMPTRFSSAASMSDARAVASALGIELRVLDIDGLYQRYLDDLGPSLDALGARKAPGDVTFENVQARIRGNVLMAISNRLGHLVLTTGNKSEIAVGYCTLYGDMAGALAVISDVPKTFVYEICRELNAREQREIIPRSVLEKAPSAELREGQRDEDSLPPYAQLDAVLERLVERALSIDAIVAEGFSRELCERVAKLVRAAEHKRRQMPPGLILTGKAFGPGRRYPIAAR